jgi:hypothetical protein
MARFEQFHVMDKVVLSRGWVRMVLLGIEGDSAMSLLSASVVYAKAKGGGRRDKNGVWIWHCLLLSVVFFVLRLLLVAQLFRGEEGGVCNIDTYYWGWWGGVEARCQCRNTMRIIRVSLPMVLMPVCGERGVVMSWQGGSLFCLFCFLRWTSSSCCN